MQLSWLRSTALALLLTACGEDGGGDDGKTQEDAAATGTPKDAGHDAGSASGLDAGVVIPKDGSVPDTGTKPPVGDGGSGAVADAGTVGDAGGSTVADTGVADAGSTPPPVDAGNTPPPVDAGGGASEESFAALYASIFMPKCLSCHNATHTSGLRMDSVTEMHASLLKVVGADQNTTNGPGSPCSKMTTNPRVAPGDPSKSWLLVMIAPHPPCGKQMPPPDDGPKLPEAEQKRIRDWIAQGAKNN